MAHTISFDGFVFIFNGDLSGSVSIINEETGERMEVPGSSLLRFVANHIRAEKIGELEQITEEEILGIKIHD